jgi:hypothetical protein
MPITNRKFSWTDDELLKDVFGFRESPARRSNRREGRAAKISPVQTGIRGFQIADSCFYYPEDRGIAENVRLGTDTARAISS